MRVDLQRLAYTYYGRTYYIGMLTMAVLTLCLRCLAELALPGHLFFDGLQLLLERRRVEGHNLLEPLSCERRGDAHAALGPG